MTSACFSNFGFILIHSHVRGDFISLVVLVDKEWNADLTEFRIFQTPSPALALRPQYAPTNLELGSRPQNRRLDHNTTRNMAVMPSMVMMIVTNILNSNPSPCPKGKADQNPIPLGMSDQRRIYSDFALQNKRDL